MSDKPFKSLEVRKKGQQKFKSTQVFPRRILFDEKTRGLNTNDRGVKGACLMAEVLGNFSL